MATLQRIRIEDYWSGTAHDRIRAIEQVGEAYATLAFAQLIDTDVTPYIMEETAALQKRFFSLSPDLKMTCHRDGMVGIRGYAPPLSEKALRSSFSDLKEFYDIGRDFGPNNALADAFPQNIWPDRALIRGFKTRIKSLYYRFERTHNALLEMIAIANGFPHDAFTKLTRNGDSDIRLLHYLPPAHYPDLAAQGARWGWEHEDMAAVALIFSQTIKCLRVKMRDGKWLDVEAEPGSLIANTGDTLKEITSTIIPCANGPIQSTTHEVRAPENLYDERYSVAWFGWFRPEVMINKSQTARDFLNARTARLIQPVSS